MGEQHSDAVESYEIKSRFIILSTNRELIHSKYNYKTIEELSGSFSDEGSVVTTNGYAEIEINPVDATQRDNSILRQGLFRNDGEYNLFLNGGESQFRKRDRNLIFVHGVNNDIETAVTSAAAITDGFGLKANTFAFCWPSERWSYLDYFPDSLQQFILRAYDHDVSRSEFSFKPFASMISQLDAFQLGEINLFAHSRGSFIVASGMRDLVISANQSLRKIKSVSFAAPDISNDAFRTLFSEPFASMRGIFTVYVNGGTDIALVLGQWRDGLRRVGRAPIPIGMANVDVVYVTNDVSMIGHSFFSGVRELASDLRGIVIDGIPARERSSVMLVDSDHFNLVEH
ncbi:alpha/beta hydrolase [Mesorhizobium sp. B2-3-12]|uniref:alpha/beta hydrolase n=1 Tax=Mesorhizobium sp. B2-3-12 TaxID=2589952 RepID=UPI0015E2FDAA|nr:alpha/beta hydrolase [Mesorhizobium sp. B2-3-12]